MSYILDALKKSEQERELVRMLRTAGASHHFWMPARRRIWPALIGLALLTGITLTVLRFWSPADSSHAANADRNAAAVPTAAIETSKASAIASSPRRVAAAAEHPKIATEDLAAQLQFASSAPEPVAAAKPQASDVVVAKTAPPSAALVTQAPVDPATVPFLREMPNEFRRKLPELVVNVHLYSANEAENLVYINNQQLRRGEQLEGGIRLEEIVPEGVVLSYAGTLFKLPRPN
jgi:general secretion pathway protein B